MAAKRGDLGGLICPEMAQFHPKMAKFQNSLQQNYIAIARSKKLEQGRSFKPTSAIFFFFATRTPLFSGVSP
jgi:hypothetical protein